MSLSSQLKSLIDEYGFEAVEEALTELKTLPLTSIRDDLDAVIANWMGEEVTQPFLINVNKKKQKKRDLPIEKSYHNVMYRICFGIETSQQSLTLDSKQRGRVSSVLGRLQEANADLSQLNFFEDWWKTTWRSKDRDNGAYNHPRPEQVLEFWWVAIRARTQRLEQEKPQESQSSTPVVVDFEERMRQRALEKRSH